MIRKNELLWGDSCKPRYHWNDDKNGWEKFLDLNTTDYDLTVPGTYVPTTSKTVIPEPEKHFSLIELIKQNLNRSFAILCHLCSSEACQLRGIKEADDN